MYCSFFFLGSQKLEKLFFNPQHNTLLKKCLFVMSQRPLPPLLDYLTFGCWENDTFFVGSCKHIMCILLCTKVWADFNSFAWRQSRRAEHINMLPPDCPHGKEYCTCCMNKGSCWGVNKSVRTPEGAEAATGHEDQIKDGGKAREEEREGEGAREREEVKEETEASKQ